MMVTEFAQCVWLRTASRSDQSIGAEFRQKLMFDKAKTLLFSHKNWTLHWDI